MSLGLSTVTVVESGTATSADFRSVVLRGANVASYKFALAKSILTLARAGATARLGTDVPDPEIK